jgi:hypothetical protein
MFKRQNMFNDLRRKTVIVSIYYCGDKEPVIALDDWDSPDELFLTDAIEEVMIKHNPDSDVFDVCIDETKPWIFNDRGWFSRQMFKLMRK